MSGRPIFQTERLSLRILDESEAPSVLSYCLRNRDFLQEWEPGRDEGYYSLSQQRELLAGDLQAMAEGRLFKVWIFERDGESPQTVIGTIALNNIVKGCFCSCHLGYRLDRLKTGRGYMTEGVRKVIDYAFGELGLHRIEANVMPRNMASLKVLGKLGFANEGVGRKYLKINGQWEDHIHMVLLNERME